MNCAHVISSSFLREAARLRESSLTSSVVASALRDITHLVNATTAASWSVRAVQCSQDRWGEDTWSLICVIPCHISPRSGTTCVQRFISPLWKYLLKLLILTAVKVRGFWDHVKSDLMLLLLWFITFCIPLCPRCQVFLSKIKRSHILSHANILLPKWDGVVSKRLLCL